MYDPHSARLLRSTDWRRVGALRNPPSSVRQWGAALNATELEALGQARLASGWQGSASHEFWQFHPIDQTAVILCRANASAGPGWSIDLLGEDGRATGWVLKADRGAELHCACHCDWRPDCPGVVSVPAGSPPPPADLIHESAPEPRLAARSWAERRRERVAQRMGWADRAPASVVDAAPESQQTASVPDGWRWPSSAPTSTYAGEADRGALHAHQDVHELPAAEPVRLARAERRGFFAALFSPRSEPAPAVERPTEWPALPHQGGLIFPGGEDTALPQLPPAGEVEAPTPLFREPWVSTALPPAAEYEPPTLAWPEPSMTLDHEPAALESPDSSWSAPTLPAPDAAAIGWDAPTAVWSDPEPSYEALPAPEPEPERLSTQAEVDYFIDVAWDTAPEPEPAADVPALLSPDEK